MPPHVLSLGYSPCPNDTFIFAGLSQGQIACPFQLQTHLEDVETLNHWAFAQQLDVTKLSFYAWACLRHKYRLLTAGSALGRGCGPLLVVRDPQAWRQTQVPVIAIPGRWTTAHFLLQLAMGPHSFQAHCQTFDTIMPAVQQGHVDAGLIIHESRFTYQQLGLTAVLDLGQWWEEQTGLPLPLGCIAARDELGANNHHQLEEAIRASLDFAYAQPAAVASYIRQHAQELADEVTQAHINLYVNEFSRDLGAEGQAAVAELLARGRQQGLCS